MSLSSSEREHEQPDGVVLLPSGCGQVLCGS
jgi:hypothetical protein